MTRRSPGPRTAHTGKTVWVGCLSAGGGVGWGGRHIPGIIPLPVWKSAAKGSDPSCSKTPDASCVYGE